MDIPEFRNAKYIDANNARIDCEINHPNYGWIKFTCDPTDRGALWNQKEFYDLIVASSQVAAYTPVVISDEQLAAEARAQRDYLLSQSDWTQLPDVPQTVKDVWAAYRQALRDVPQQVGFPSTIDWPVQPQ